MYVSYHRVEVPQPRRLSEFNVKVLRGQLAFLTPVVDPRQHTDHDQQDREARGDGHQGKQAAHADSRGRRRDVP
jgi:hypothetical protein